MPSQPPSEQRKWYEPSNAWCLQSTARNHSEHSKSKRHLENLRLKGTSAVFTALPSARKYRISAGALAFRIRQGLQLAAQVQGQYNMPADELVCVMAHRYKIKRHDAVVDALLEAGWEADIVSLREVCKHFKDPNGTGLSVTPDGVLILHDGTGVAFDVTIVNTLGEVAAMRNKNKGHGTPAARKRALDERAATHKRVREAVKAGTMTPLEAQEARDAAAQAVQAAYHCGYELPTRLGGCVFKCVGLTPLGGWFSGARDWMESAVHTGDQAGSMCYDPRYEHASKTWASSKHRQATMQATGIAQATATYKWVQDKARQELIRDMGARAKATVPVLTPPTLLAAYGEYSAHQADATEEEGEEEEDEAEPSENGEGTEVGRDPGSVPDATYGDEAEDEAKEPNNEGTAEGEESEEEGKRGTGGGEQAAEAIRAIASGPSEGNANKASAASTDGQRQATTYTGAHRGVDQAPSRIQSEAGTHGARGAQRTGSNNTHHTTHHTTHTVPRCEVPAVLADDRITEHAGRRASAGRGYHENINSKDTDQSNSNDTNNTYDTSETGSEEESDTAQARGTASAAAEAVLSDSFTHVSS